MESVKEIHKLFDQVLSELGQPSLMANEHFEPDDSNNDIYQKFWSTKDESYLDFMIEIFETGISFHIENTDEIPEWSIKQLKKDPSDFKRVVKAILSCTPIVEVQGKKSKLKFLNENGISEYEYVFVNGIGLNFIHQKKTKELQKYFE